jgi:hypothetical protein
MNPLKKIAHLHRCVGWLFAVALACGLAATARAGTMDDAVALYNAGKYQQARELCITVAKQASDYPLAEYYNALCLYELKDYKKFLRKVESVETNKLAIDAKQKEHLASKYIDAAYRARRFDLVLPRIEAFWKDYPGSPHTGELLEYKIAALFEWGQKKAYEAGILKDEAQAQKRRDEAKASLQGFLAQALLLEDDRYRIVDNRNLEQDIFAARVMLGDEQAAVAELPLLGAEDQEKYSRLRIALHNRNSAGDIGNNIQMMEDFIWRFPNSISIPRMRFDLASLNFQRGADLCDAAAQLENSGDQQAAAQKLAGAKPSFARMRQLYDKIDVDETNGIKRSDFLDLQKDFLLSFVLEENFDGLFQATNAMIAKYPAGDLSWAVAKLYEGIGLMKQIPPNLGKAAAAFDAVMSIGLCNQVEHDKLYVRAVYWRFFMAHADGDNARADALLRSVLNGNCEKGIKERMRSDLAKYINPPDAQ